MTQVVGEVTPPAAGPRGWQPGLLQPGVAASLAPEYLDGRAPEVQRAGRPLAPATGVQYYHVPPLKKPMWKWHIPTYFWLGGLGSGAFLLATIASLLRQREDEAAIRAGRYVALASMLISPILLAEDLGRPERAHHMFRILKTRSMMNVGAFFLAALGGLTGLSAVLQLLSDLLGAGAKAGLQRASGWLGVVGAPVAIFVGTYTGALLSATSIALWAKTRLFLAPVFFASALATGAAAIGLAIPADPNHHGYISEHHAFGQRQQPAGDYAEDLAASMLATVLGVPFDPEQAWDQRKEQWLLSGEIVKTMNISCTAEAQDDGRWVTVVSAVVFCG